MKKIVFFSLLALISFLTVKAQKQSGIVYSEHDGINKAKAMWAAFVKGDKDTFLSFFADSVLSGSNGSVVKKTKEQFAGNMTWWNKEFKNLSIIDDKPAFPDAIQYKEEGLFVQDWLKVLGTHEKSGINLDWALHNIYRFNKDGKIDILLQYYDDKLFTEINNSSRSIENGIVYINHPYIVTVRKLINAWCAENLDSLAKFYSPKAIFFESPFKQNKFINLDESLKEAKDFFAKYDNIKMVQLGYPDCIYYAKEGSYVVYSWWTLSCTTKDGKKISGIPMMISDGFDKDGKITNESNYYSSNHFQ